MSNDKNKRFKLLDIARDGKGIGKKPEYSPSGIKRFFISFKDSFWKLLTVNIIMIIGNIPIMFLIATLGGFTKDQTLLPFYDVFQNINAIFSIEGASPSMMSLLAVYGVQNNVYIPTVLTYVFYGISAISLFTFGIVNVGTAYVLRNITKGEPVFVWSDCMYAIKRNYKQAIPFGIIDILINVILVFNIYITVTSEGFLFSFMFWCNVVLWVLFFFIRPYVYIQMVTFKLSIFKQFKNALIFTLLGFKRNILALLGCFLLTLFELMVLFTAGGILVPLAIALPMVFAFSGCAYMKVFAAYYRIKDIMIDPYLEEHPEEREEIPDDEPIMHDDVTERERLAEIKKRNGLV